MGKKQKVIICIKCGDKDFTIDPICFKCLTGITRFEDFLNSINRGESSKNWNRIKIIKQLKKDKFELKYWKLKRIKGRLRAV